MKMTSSHCPFTRKGTFIFSLTDKNHPTGEWPKSHFLPRFVFSCTLILCWLQSLSRANFVAKKNYYSDRNIYSHIFWKMARKKYYPDRNIISWLSARVNYLLDIIKSKDENYCTRKYLYALTTLMVDRDISLRGVKHEQRR